MARIFGGLLSKLVYGGLISTCFVDIFKLTLVKSSLPHVRSFASTPSKGGHWTGKIYFDPDADVSAYEANSELSTDLKQPDVWPYCISYSGLKKQLKRCINTSENIEKIWVYKKPLGEWQFTSNLLYHAYVVLETNQFWWSLEKNAEGLTLQRSKSKDTVVQYYRQKKRTNTDYWVPEVIMEDKAEMSNILLKQSLIGLPKLKTGI